MGASDLTSRTHAPGEGAVGRVFATQQSERFLDFVRAGDPATVEDFRGETITSMICVPFSGASDALGCIQLVNKVGGERQFGN